MTNPPRPTLKLVKTDAFTSPYLLQRVRSLDEVLAARKQHSEAEPQPARGGERQSGEQAASAP